MDEAGVLARDEVDRRAVRDRMLRRFELWLDEVLQEEEEPAGLPAEILEALRDGEEFPPPAQAGDLYSLLSTMAALTQEVKLQGRTFEKMKETFTSAQGVTSSLSEGQAEVLEQLRRLSAQKRREAEQEAHRETLGTLIDVRDRLQRGLQSARAQLERVPAELPKGWLSRLLPGRRASSAPLREAIQALAGGYDLTLQRVEETLQRLEVRPIECEGLPFDPHRMKAVDIEQTSEAPDGTVLEVYRPGYTWRGELFQPAEVRVARAPLDAGEKKTSLSGEEEHEES